MRVMLFLSMVLAVSCLALAGCETEPVSTGSGTASSGRMTNADLESSVRAKLDSDSKVKQADLSVTADADRNEVSLSGTVESADVRTRAIELAKSAKDGLVVNDKIVVKAEGVKSDGTPSLGDYTKDKARAARDEAARLGEKIGDSLEDAWIHTKIVSKLVSDPDTPQRKINVDVVDNVVTLRGTVDSAQQKADAERIAKETDGVKRVNNLLKVAKPAKG